MTGWMLLMKRSLPGTWEHPDSCRNCSFSAPVKGIISPSLLPVRTGGSVRLWCTPRSPCFHSLPKEQAKTKGLGNCSCQTPTCSAASQEKASQPQIAALPTRASLVAAPSLPGSAAAGDSVPEEQSLSAASTLRTIFLLSLFCEPLLRELLVLIFVPLAAEVQVLGLRRERSTVTVTARCD